MKQWYLPATLLLTGAILCANAQNPFTFTNANSKLGTSVYHSGNSITVADMNGDGLDDIAVLDDANDLYYVLQQTGQNFNSIHGASTGTGSCWSMVVADANNDGVRDVAVGYNGSVKYVKPNTALTSFPVVTLPNSGFFLQNMNFADVDNNGFADIFGCNDVGTSAFWGNSGTGTYPATTNFFSTNNPGAIDNSGNYGSIWTDVDNDGDVDFYIAHCRQSTGNTDGRRLDQLFINNGSGNYILDTTNARGLRNLHQTWTASFEDIDNDGDFDCLLTQTDVASQIFLNDGNGYFTEITNSTNFFINITAYQSKMADFDNDSYVDIMISGDDARLFHNNGDNTFTYVSGAFDNNGMKSFAVGDLNHDGRLDMYSSYASGYNSPTTTDDVVWMNTTNNSNHFITFNLQGTTSTRDALGAKVIIYGAFGKQVREVRAGESYGTTNTFACHFGLGSSTQIDSAVVKWPKGGVTKLGTTPADQFITVIEGQCYSANNIITATGALALCGGQPLTMSATPGYVYLWSNGATTPSITISAEGEYNVRITDTISGCSSISKTVTILTTPDETPVVTLAGAPTFCGGDSVTLTSTPASAYQWSNGETTQSITVKNTGSYTVTVQGSCAPFSSQAVTVNKVNTDVTTPVSPAVCSGNSATIQLSTTATAYWFTTDTGSAALYHGATYQTPALTQDVTYYVEVRDSAEGQSGSVGPVDNSFGAGSFFNGNQYQLFDAYKTVVLKSVKVYTGSSKNRTIQLRNATGTVLQQTTILIDSGVYVINLNWTIPAGNNYQLGWAPGSSPNFFRNNDGAVYPYTLNGLVSVTGTSAGTSGFWYAYYDWQIEEPVLACASPRVPVTVIVNPLPTVTFTGLGSTYYEGDGDVTITTTPTGGTLTGTGVSGVSFSPSNAGVGGPYTVTYAYTDNNGCSAEYSQQVTVLADTSTQVSVNDMAGITEAVLYPNPNNGSFAIRFTSAVSEDVTFTLTDAVGRTVLKQIKTAAKGDNVMHLSQPALSGGCYYLQLKGTMGSAGFRVFIN